MQEALSLARGELGDEAVVLNTRQVKAGGLLGLAGSSKVEVTAAADDVVEPPSAADGPTPCYVASAPVAMSTMGVSVAERPVVRDPGQYHLPEAAPGAHTPSANPEIAQLRLELKQLGSLVQGLLNARTSVTDPPVHRSCEGSLRPPKDGLTPLLLMLGVEEELARQFMPELLDIGDGNALQSALAAVMRPYAKPLSVGNGSPRVVALVGPTGVGKTTTLAKLAARFSLEQGKRVALVTADTFRIGAVEQLRTYARIMGVPLEIALSPEEVREGVAKHSDCDLVLVDTVGRSHRNAEHLSELKGFLDSTGGIETHLVVAASLAAEIQNEVIESFAIFSPARLVFTKLDESACRGCLVNLPLKTGLGISCTTAGQNVPQDIQFADANAIARSLVEAG